MRLSRLAIFLPLSWCGADGALVWWRGAVWRWWSAGVGLALAGVVQVCSVVWGSGDCLNEDRVI